MNRNQIDMTQQQLLKTLQEELDEAGIPVVYQNDGQLPSGLLKAHHLDVGAGRDELSGEYLFLPLPETEIDVQYFMLSLAVSDSLPAETLVSITRAIGKINFLLPNGNFIIGPSDQVLVYRCVTVLRTDEPEERLMEIIRYLITISLELTGQWLGILLALEAGQLSYEDFTETLKDLL